MALWIWREGGSCSIHERHKYNEEEEEEETVDKSDAAAAAGGRKERKEGREIYIKLG